MQDDPYRGGTVRNRRDQVTRRAMLAGLIALTLRPALPGVLDEPAGKDRFLPVGEAFRVRWALQDPHLAEVEFQIAPGYYLYRERIHVELKAPAGGWIGVLDLPPGEIKDDPYIGRQAVLHQSFTARLPLRLPAGPGGALELLTSWQGCAEAGLCYPPVHKRFMLARVP